MNISRILASALLLAASACAKTEAETTTRAPPATASARPHGSHEAAHGGIISMTADLHFETVLEQSGRHEVYFSDAARGPLPAAALAAVSMTLERKGTPSERLELEPDESGAFWVADGQPLGNTALTKAAVTFNRPGEPATTMPLAMPEPSHHGH